MTLAEPLAWSPAPLQLQADLRLTPEQFEQVCAANPEAVLELSADGQLITMPPHRQRNRLSQLQARDAVAALGRSGRRLEGL